MLIYAMCASVCDSVLCGISVCLCCGGVVRGLALCCRDLFQALPGANSVLNSNACLSSVFWFSFLTFDICYLWICECVICARNEQLMNMGFLPGINIWIRVWLYELLCDCKGLWSILGPNRMVCGISGVPLWNQLYKDLCAVGMCYDRLWHGES